MHDEGHSPLFQFSSKVEASRRLVLEEFAAMPAPFGDVIREQYLARASAKNLAGEFAPWLIADLLGARIDDSLDDLAAAWLLLHTYVLMVDDLLDDSAVDPKLLQIASGLCLQRSLTRLFKAAPAALQATDYIDRFCRQTAEAVTRELQQDRFFSRAAIAHRMAVLKLWSVFLLCRMGRSADIAAAETVIDDLACALQLLDDLTDWEEDWRLGRHTKPIAIAIDRGRASGFVGETPTADDLFAALVITGAYTETLAEADVFLRRVRECAREGSIAAAYVDHQLRGHDELLRQVDAAASARGAFQQPRLGASFLLHNG